MLKIILTLVTLQGGMLSRLPNVPYLTFFSYWSITCILPIYTMVWQWTTSNTVRALVVHKFSNFWPGEEHAEEKEIFLEQGLPNIPQHKLLQRR